MNEFATGIGRMLGYFVFPLSMVLVSWIVCSTIWGESMLAKGLGIAVGGLSLSIWDCIFRLRRQSSSRLWSLFASPKGTPSIYYVPIWVVGVLIIAGGISVMLED